MVTLIKQTYYLFLLFMVLLGFLGCSGLESDMVHPDSTNGPGSQFFRGNPGAHGVFTLTRNSSPRFEDSGVTDQGLSSFELSWLYQGTRGEFNGISDVFGSGMIGIEDLLVFHNGMSLFGLSIDSGELQWKIDLDPYIESRSYIELYRISVPVYFQNQVFITFGTNLFLVNPIEGTYQKVATWTEYFYETGVIIWEDRIFAMDWLGNLVEYDPIQKSFHLRFSSSSIQGFQSIPLSFAKVDSESMVRDSVEGTSPTNSADSLAGMEPLPVISPPRIHPFARALVDSSSSESMTFTFLLQAENYLVAISPARGTVVLVPKDQLGARDNREDSKVPTPRYEGSGYTFGAQVSQLPMVSITGDQEILVMPFISELGTQSHTLLLGFSLTEQEILWQTKIDSFQVAPMVIHKDQVFVPTTTGIVSLSLVTGEVVWHQHHQGLLSLSGLVSPGGEEFVLVATTQEQLIEFHGSTGLPRIQLAFDGYATPKDSFITSEGSLAVGNYLVARIGSNMLLLLYFSR